MNRLRCIRRLPVAGIRLKLPSSDCTDAIRAFRPVNALWSEPGSLSRAFTLIELLVVLGIIAVLASLLLPVLCKSKQAGYSAKCKGNLRQLSIALQMYSDDFGFYCGYMQFTNSLVTKKSEFYNWSAVLEPYTQNHWTNALYRCPAYRGETRNLPITGSRLYLGSYGYNTYGTKVLGGMGVYTEYGMGSGQRGPPEIEHFIRPSKLVAPTDMIAIADANLYTHENAGSPLPKNIIEPFGINELDQWWGWGTIRGTTARPNDVVRMSNQRHGGIFNLVFCDGHVEGIKRTALFGGKNNPNTRRFNNDNEPHVGDVPEGF